MTKLTKKRRKTMGIKIETEKIVVRGERKRKVVKIEMLKAIDLPAEYCSGESVTADCHNKLSVWYSQNDRQVRQNILAEESIYSEKTFAKNLATIRVCGNNLARINKRLAKENADWHGNETYII